MKHLLHASRNLVQQIEAIEFLSARNLDVPEKLLQDLDAMIVVLLRAIRDREQKLADQK